MEGVHGRELQEGKRKKGEGEGWREPRESKGCKRSGGKGG